MINYVKSELYRLLRTQTTYYMLLMILFFLLFMLGLTWYTGLNDPNFLYDNTAFVFRFSQSGLVTVLYVIPFGINVLFGDEYGHGTFKNSVSYGMKREVIYLGKLITSVLVSFMMSVIVLMVFIPLAELLLENSGPVYRQGLILSIWHSIPLFLAALTVAHMLSFITSKATTQILSYFVMMSLVQTLLLRVKAIVGMPDLVMRLFPNYLIQARFWEAPLGSLFCWGILFLYFGVTTIIGLTVFYKRDI